MSLLFINSEFWEMNSENVVAGFAAADIILKSII